jgi:membrane dipeptidase
MDARQLHASVPVADAHADALMWNRDLNVRSTEGHVDFPRLAEAGVKLQCFPLVTRGLPFVGGFELFARWRGYPPSARAGEWARGLFQLELLERDCRASGGTAVFTTTREQLAGNLAGGRLSAIAGVEGGHVLEGRVDRVEELYGRGVRFMGLTHLSNNELGGSSFRFAPELDLTPLGREVLDACAAVGMVVDVAHASRSALKTLFAQPRARLFCSHTGCAAATPSWRNLEDADLRVLADRGGVIGIMFAPQFVGARTVEAVAAHMAHAVDVVGEDAVCFGSDFDGFIRLPRGMRDVTGLPLLTDALLRRGMPTSRVEKLVGRNLVRFFSDMLPHAPL